MRKCKIAWISFVTGDFCGFTWTCGSQYWSWWPLDPCYLPCYLYKLTILFQPFPPTPICGQWILLVIFNCKVLYTSRHLVIHPILYQSHSTWYWWTVLHLFRLTNIKFLTKGVQNIDCFLTWTYYVCAIKQGCLETLECNNCDEIVVWIVFFCVLLSCVASNWY